MNEIVAGVVEWLAATGAPNGLVVLALLTHPATWARNVRDRVAPVLDAALPGGRSS